MDLRLQAQHALSASRQLVTLSSAQKNTALECIAQMLLDNKEVILAANQEDLDRAKAAGQTVMLDRLLLTPERIESIAHNIRAVIELEDEVGKIIDERVRPNGLHIQRVRCPLGVVGIIYESRPEVTVDSTVLSLKSGNAVMLKGGSDAISSNRVLVQLMREALGKTAIPVEAVQFIDTTDRAVTAEFLKLSDYLSVLIPRGGRGLIDFVRQNATVPMIETGASVVHTYIDADADLSKAIPIVVNAKTRRVSVCNALDTLLVHEVIAESFLHPLAQALLEKKTELRCDDRSFPILKTFKCGPEQNPYPHLRLASPDDFGCEFLDNILAIKIVKNLDEALTHIAEFSLKHSEAILTENHAVAERFLNEVDAATVYWNASVAFTDGAQFGLGAEAGISTQKLHTRGPFALEGLTTFKWVVRGDGQIRP